MTQAMAVDDFLEHMGVKGMKWGKHSAAKPTSGDINDARIRDAGRIREMNAQTDKLNLSKTGSKAQGDAAKKLVNMRASYLKNPDRATALRMTKGDKAVAAVFAIGLPGAGTLGVAAGITARVAIRKSVERSVAKANA